MTEIGHQYCNYHGLGTPVSHGSQGSRLAVATAFGATLGGRSDGSGTHHQRHALVIHGHEYGCHGKNHGKPWDVGVADLETNLKDECE